MGNQVSVAKYSLTSSLLAEEYSFHVSTYNNQTANFPNFKAQCSGVVNSSPQDCAVTSGNAASVDVQAYVDDVKKGGNSTVHVVVINTVPKKKGKGSTAVTFTGSQTFTKGETSTNFSVTKAKATAKVSG